MRHACLCFAILFWLSSLCIAQDSSTGSVRGIVVDPSGGRIAGASIALVNNSTAFHYQQTSDAEGRFGFDLLSPGDYSVRVTAEKMSPQLSPFLRVTLGGVTEVNFRLEIAGARENVTVTAEPRAVETEPRGLSAVIDERAILNLPLNGRRSPTSACLRHRQQPTPAGKIPRQTATSHSAASAVFRPAIWSMAETTTMLSLDRHGAGIAPRTSFQMKLFRNFESRRIQLRLSLGGPAERW